MRDGQCATEDGRRATVRNKGQVYLLAAPIDRGNHFSHTRLGIDHRHRHHTISIGRSIGGNHRTIIGTERHHLIRYPVAGSISHDSLYRIGG